jgi:DNA primase
MTKKSNYFTVVNQQLIEAYVKSRFAKPRVYKQEFIVKCPFSNHQHDDKFPAMNINRYTGLYYCFKCGAKGNLFHLAKHFNDNLKNFT